MIELIYPQGWDPDVYIKPSPLILTLEKGGIYLIMEKYIITYENLTEYKEILLKDYNIEIRWRIT